jgi:hypothetical protein
MKTTDVLKNVASTVDNSSASIVLYALIAFIAMHEEDRLASMVKSFTDTYLYPKIQENNKLRMN